jgi:hypothetical protein
LGSFAVFTTSSGDIGVAVDFSEFTWAGKSSAEAVVPLRQAATHDKTSHDEIAARRIGIFNLAGMNGVV